MILLVIGTYAGELDVRWANFRADLVHIIDPCLVRAEVVRRGTNDLDVAAAKSGARRATSPSSVMQTLETGNRDEWMSVSVSVRDSAEAEVISINVCVRV